MILGIGNDLCAIDRIAGSLARFGARFEQRIFTTEEQAKAHRRQGNRTHNTMASTYAKRFAAKEAFGKALGTGIGAGSPIFWKEVEVVNLPSGRPSIRLHGRAKAALDALVPEGYAAVIHLTLADEYPTAQAFVIIEARERGRIPA